MAESAQVAWMPEIRPGILHTSPHTKARIPSYARAVFEAMRVDGPDTSALHGLSERDWTSLLKLCDRSQLTLQFAELARPAMPDWVRERLAKDREGNAARFRRLKDEHAEITKALWKRGIEFITLKGFTHCPELTADPLLRAQGDIDLWVATESIEDAHQALQRIGYRDHGRSEHRHRPPMFRPGNWEWKGDFYAPDLPIGVELHYALWDEKQSFIGGVPQQEFWDRRRLRIFDDQLVMALNLPDTVGFACLHLLTHILRGDVRLQRAWEISRFLANHQGDESFWRNWQTTHPPSLQRLEMIVFRLCSGWFGGAAPRLVQDEVKLAPTVELWLDHYSQSPVEALFQPIKDELWLHLALIHSRSKKVALFVERVFPMRAAAIRNVIHSDPEAGTIKCLRRNAPFLFSRSWHHTAALLHVAAGGVKWWWRQQELGREFVTYQVGSTLFNFGAFLFFFLYNLYILGIGLHEDVIGQVQGATTAGTLLGALPAAALVRKFGLRTAVLTALVGGAASMIARALVVERAGLLAGSFLNGVFFSIWAVTLLPAVADFTTERNRAKAFSYVSALGIGIGVAAGLVGGHLPAWFRHYLGVGELQSIRLTLVTGAMIVLTAAIPISKLKLAPRGIKAQGTYPRSRFIVGFLGVLALWSFATGAFNPFTSAFFSTAWHLDIPSIGRLFSFSQLAQVAAIIAAPALLRRLGDAAGIAVTQLVVALALGCLAFSGGGAGGQLLFVSYMSFQYSSEPGLFHVLMAGVKPGERSGASAQHFLVVSLAGSAAALLAGSGIARWGYGGVLPIAAVLAFVASILFFVLGRTWGTEGTS